MQGPPLLLAAFPPELCGLDRSPPAGWTTATTGIGAIAAAVETTRLLALHRPARVLFVGTCGAYDGRLPIGSVLAARHALATSLEEVEGRAYRPAKETTRWAATWKLPLPAHDVAVPPAITLTAAGALTLSRVAAVEHLELTGVFAACAAAGVPAAAALGVANQVGPDAHAQWKVEHARVSALVVAALHDVLAGAT